MIQIDIQMPANCLECPVCNEYLNCAIQISGKGWGQNDVREYEKSRPEWCPLQELDPVAPVYNARSNWYMCGKCGFSMTSGMHCKGCLIPATKVNYCARCGTRVNWRE